MGEIAEMMLDGTMCQGCGEWLHDGDDGPGYPGLCDGCRPSAEQAERDFDAVFPRTSRRLKRVKRQQLRQGGGQ